MHEDDDGESGGGGGGGGGGVGGGGGGGGGIDDDRRSVRHHGKHHKMAPPNRWSTVGAAADGRPGGGRGAMVGGHHHRHDMLAAAGRNDTAAARTSPHVLHAAPDSMCYTTNEVLVIIAVTCFLNFAFILLIMTCVHCFTDPSHHKKFGAVAYAELGDELFDADMIDADTVTLLNPTKSPTDANDCPYEKRAGGFNEFDLESCAPYQSLMQHEHQCKSRRRSEEDLFMFE